MTKPYINAKSNHPPNIIIIKQLPLSVEKRLQTLSSNEPIFNKAEKHYQETLDMCGYKHKLQYSEVLHKRNNNGNRKQNIIWFNTPHSKIVSTNIGKCFLSLLNKHFPKKHKYHELFNRLNVKTSYSCMPNVNSAIHNHNKSIPQETETINKSCNCVKDDFCPLDNLCLTSNEILLFVLIMFLLKTNLISSNECKCNRKRNLVESVCKISNE